MLPLAVLICVAATWTAFQLLERARAASEGRRTAWLGAAAMVLGCGIWATHFVAMLAYGPGLPMGYDVPLTVTSALIAVAFSAVGLALLMATPAWSPLAGLILGLGIGAMHYTGMLALQIPGYVDWDPAGVAVSMGLGLVVAALAGAASRRAHLSPLLLTLSICILHFGGMAAFQPVATPLVAFEPPLHGREVLMIGVAATTILIICFSALAAGLDRYLAYRSWIEAERLRALTEASFEGVILHDGTTILDVNGSALRLLGLTQDALLGRPVLELVGPEQRPAFAACLERDEPSRCETDLQRANGSVVPVEILSRQLEIESSGSKRVIAIRDLRERREAEERIRHLAHHDPLTGLPNRALFTDRLAQALALAERQTLPVAVLCLDLDRFKEVNDTHGHPVGDALLKEVARLLKACVRTADTVARLGGDEFAVIQVGLLQPTNSALVAERVVRLLAAPVVVDGMSIEIGASIGVAIFPSDAKTVDALLIKADLALYRAKREGRSTYRMFESGMDSRLRNRRELEAQLRQAVAHKQLRLLYQPQADTATGQATGFEALLRWEHPTRGTVSPTEFVPLAEETGLIRSIGAWVLHTACAEAVRWPAHLRLGVNLSPLQFGGADLPAMVERTLRETGLPAGRLELEITEGVLIRETENVLDALLRLKALGVRIAMDDFGTGYSSLSYLHRFPIDRIKIDRTFIADMHQRESGSIVRAILGLSDSLGIEVIAEGVETREQLAALQVEHCHEVQGFLIGRPMPGDEVAAFIGRHRTASPRAPALPAGLLVPA